MMVISKTGNKYDIQYQQYISGLYVAIYKDITMLASICIWASLLMGNMTLSKI